MNLSAPKTTTFYVALVLGVLGVLGTLIPLGFVTGLAPWLVIAGFIVLVLGNTMSNL